MKTAPSPNRSARFYTILVGIFALAILAAPTYSVVSGALAVNARQENVSANGLKVVSPESSRVTKNLNWYPSLVAPVPLAEGIEIFAADCTTPQTTFQLGQTVCAKVSGSGAQRRLSFVYPSSLVAAQADVVNDPQTMTFTLAATPTSLAGDTTVENRGRWTVVSTATSDGYARALAWFTVTDPDRAVADLSVVDSKTSVIGDTIDFNVYVVNHGPDAATNVAITDDVPAGATFESATQESGPPFTCVTPSQGASTGTTTCTISSLAMGAVAEFKFRYKGTGAAGTEVSHQSDISSATTELNNSDNSSDGVAAVNSTGGGAATCVLDCPNNITVTANATQGANQGAFVTFSSAEGLGECGDINSSVPSGSFFPIGTTTVTVTSATGSGSCSFTVTVAAAGSAPTIACPADKVVTAPTGATEATVDPGTPTTTPTSGVSVSGVRSDNQLLSEPYQIGTTHITWTVTDASGLSSSCTQRITVNSDACGTDTTPPTLTAPANVTLDTPAGTVGSCGLVVGESQLGTPDVTDNCVVNVTRTGVPAGNFFPVGTTTITYTATDSGGNSVTASQTVTVNDKTAPIIAAPADASYTCLSEVPAAHPSQATRGEVLDESGNPLPPGPPVDNCGTPAITVSESVSGVGNASSPRVIVRTYTATDSAGNSASATQTITVIDSSAPTVALVGASSITHECHTAFDDPGVTKSDNCDQNVDVTTSGGFNPDVPGTYVITYTATDDVGNTATVQRTVQVVDTTKPVITLNGGNMTVECHTSFTDPGASASDSCDTSVPVNVTGSVDVNVPGTYTLTYNSADDSGNTAVTVTRTVNVVDTTAPAVSCPSNIVVTLPPNSTATSMPVSFAAPTASDTCDSSVPVTTSHASGAVFPVGTTTVTASATDDSNNTGSCSFTVTVLYDFTGFFSPVINPPTLNNINAGRTTPIKFSLSGNKGLDIFAAGYPASQQITCNSSAPISDLEGTETSGGSTLSYSPDQYLYNWKTESAWAGTCRVLVVKLNDGSEHTLLFKFK